MNFEFLTAFLAFVRTAHYWTEMHPMLAYEADMVAVMQKHPELARLVLEPRTPVGAVERSASARARRTAEHRRNLADDRGAVSSHS